MLIQLDKKFKKKVQGIFGKYEFEVGILQDRPHRSPQTIRKGQSQGSNLSAYAGVTVRKATRKPSGQTVAQVSKELRERMRPFNYLVDPFKESSFVFSRNNKELKLLMKRFFDLCFGRTQPRRLENALQAMVRNPILRKDWGTNSPLTQKIKGFNHKLMDTAQLFKAIQAKVIKKGAMRV